MEFFFDLPSETNPHIKMHMHPDSQRLEVWQDALDTRCKMPFFQDPKVSFNIRGSKTLKSWPIYQMPEGNGIDTKFIRYLSDYHITFAGFRFKLHAKSQKLSAMQLLFTSGVTSELFKAKNETKEGMTEIWLEDGQTITSFYAQVKSQDTLGYKFLLESGKVFAEFLVHSGKIGIPKGAVQSHEFY